MLATFAPALAQVVVDVLGEHDVPADAEPQAGEYAVLVPPRRREEALAILSQQMDEVQRRAQQAPSGSGAGDVQDTFADHDEFGHEPRPLVTERFRNMAFLVTVALVPFLVLTLSRVPISMNVLLGVTAATAVGLFYLRHLRRNR